MDQAPRRKIRIGEAAAAIGTTPKALRHWISRYGDKGVSPDAEQSGTWLEFSYGDVAAFSITKYLVDIGMPSHGAFTYAMSIVKKRYPNLFDVNEPKWTWIHGGTHVHFYLRRGENIDAWSTSNLERNDDPDVVSQQTMDAARDKDFPARVVITVFVTFIIADAFRALEDMGHPPPHLEMLLSFEEASQQ